MLFLYFFFVLTAGLEPALTDDVLHPFYYLPEISTLVQLMLSRGAGMPFPVISINLTTLNMRQLIKQKYKP